MDMSGATSLTASKWGCSSNHAVRDKAGGARHTSPLLLTTHAAQADKHVYQSLPCERKGAVNVSGLWLRTDKQLVTLPLQP